MAHFLWLCLCYKSQPLLCGIDKSMCRNALSQNKPLRPYPDNYYHFQQPQIKGFFVYQIVGYNIRIISEHYLLNVYEF